MPDGPITCAPSKRCTRGPLICTVELSFLQCDERTTCVPGRLGMCLLVMIG